MIELIKLIAKKFNLAPFQTRRMRRNSSVGFPCASVEQAVEVFQELKEGGYPYVQVGRDDGSMVFASTQAGPNSDIDGFVVD